MTLNTKNYNVNMIYNETKTFIVSQKVSQCVGNWMLTQTDRRRLEALVQYQSQIYLVHANFVIKNAIGGAT